MLHNFTAVNIFSKQFKQRLSDIGVQYLMNKITNSPKAMPYKLFKTTMTPETYLSMPLQF